MRPAFPVPQGAHRFLMHPPPAPEQRSAQRPVRKPFHPGHVLLHDLPPCPTGRRPDRRRGHAPRPTGSRQPITARHGHPGRASRPKGAPSPPAETWPTRQASPGQWSTRSPTPGWHDVRPTRVHRGISSGITGNAVPVTTRRAPGGGSTSVVAKLGSTATSGRGLPGVGSTSVVAKLGSTATNGRGLPGVGSTSVVAKLGSTATNGRGLPGVGSTSVVAKFGGSRSGVVKSVSAAGTWLLCVAVTGLLCMGPDRPGPCCVPSFVDSSFRELHCVR